ncbi:hypothetical protein K1T73_01630 [Roseovarius sp. SCSIO 43702]|uniref:POTRA domain-containing protein n=1 Tax=Roseovarius sp. SCSIO 43702 TaxID=2823043 RepID=UPI001C72BCD5|nr:POTRA domain-containing protein [Roseovarius sp. SCSIO 43702]QYX57141.1 hypothetical protein K1T73_01630 [Roseovarius sp. SCSIO 43702]
MRFVLLALALLLGQGAVAQTFSVDEIEFSESAYLEAEALDAVAAPYEGVPIDLEALDRLLAEVQALYAEAGIITARPILPPQEIRDGILRIELVEARIGALRYAVPHTKPEFLRRNLTLSPGSCLTTRRWSGTCGSSRSRMISCRNWHSSREPSRAPRM